MMINGKLAVVTGASSGIGAANAIVAGVERNKRHVVIPFMMKLTCWNHALFPWAVQWLMTKTGYRRKHGHQ